MNSVTVTSHLCQYIVVVDPDLVSLSCHQGGHKVRKDAFCLSMQLAKCGAHSPIYLLHSNPLYLLCQLSVWQHTILIQAINVL